MLGLQANAEMVPKFLLRDSSTALPQIYQSKLFLTGAPIPSIIQLMAS
jgi:hypothetical protein